MITESVIDAAALWSAGLRNVIPVYGVTGLTAEIIAHLAQRGPQRIFGPFVLRNFALYAAKRHRYVTAARPELAAGKWWAKAVDVAS
jgi:hypothetical protein